MEEPSTLNHENVLNERKCHHAYAWKHWNVRRDGPGIATQQAVGPRSMPQLTVKFTATRSKSLIFKHICETCNSYKTADTHRLFIVMIWARVHELLRQQKSGPDIKCSQAQFRKGSASLPAYRLLPRWDQRRKSSKHNQCQMLAKSIWLLLLFAYFSGFKQSDALLPNVTPWTLNS